MKQVAVISFGGAFGLLLPGAFSSNAVEWEVRP